MEASSRGAADLINARPRRPAFSLAVCTGLPAAPADPDRVSVASECNTVTCNKTLTQKHQDGGVNRGHRIN